MFRKEKLFPELLLFPDAVSRAKAWKQAQKTVWSNGWYFLALLGGCILVILLKEFSRWPWNLPFPFNHCKFLIQILPPLASTYLVFHFGRRRVERSLRSQLREQGMMVCIHCSYDLRGCTGPVCPECGNSRE